jgi:hypothetical protein
MIIVVGAGRLAKAAKLLDKAREPHYEIGEVVDAPQRGPRVVYE